MQKAAFSLLLFYVAASICGSTGLPDQPQFHPKRVRLLGAKECTWGPSYWCKNLTAAATCHATKHCIQTVWPHKTFPEDTSSICETCQDMVKQARDQLESNETQEEIKEVFEGSCNLIPIKVIKKECCKLADDFIPDLIDTLASQMNPQVVCSVAGLCNNPSHHKLLLEYEGKSTEYSGDEETSPETCRGCHTVMDIMTQKFNNLTRDQFLQRLLQICARLGTFSDACSNIVITNFEAIYERLQKEFRADKICVLSGECSAMFHKHPEIEVIPMGHVGFVNVPSKDGDDPACKLCKQLVGHLKDLLIADTSEAEFEKVLQGLCKQTNSFKDECLSIVNEYYPTIYKYLVDGLNSTVVCEFASICPGPGFDQFNGPIAPLLLEENQSKVKTLMPTKPLVAFEAQQPEQMQLPIERIGSPFMKNNIFNKEVCAFCQYFLHYIQQEITDPRTEDELKNIVDKACNRLPESVSETCVEFVNSYGEALVALLAEYVDPSTICPLIRVCPGADAQDIEVFMQGTPVEKPNCPLCLFAVTKLEDMVREDKTKDKIKDALENLCSHLHGILRSECEDFVKGYTDELVEMLIDDFTPQEICVYLKICSDRQPPAYKLGNSENMHKGNVETNEIPDYTSNGKLTIRVKNNRECPLCEFIMQQLEKDVADRSNEEEIVAAIHNVCNKLPTTLTKQCNAFVDKYSDRIFRLIVSTIDPAEFCSMLGFCDESSAMQERVDSLPCYLCTRVISVIETYIGKVPESEIENVIRTVCSIMPKSVEQKCDQFIENYGDMIYNLLKEGTEPREICSLIVCSKSSVAFSAQKAQAIVAKCGVCRTLASLVEDLLANPTLDHQADHVFGKACAAMPIKRQNQCAEVVESHGDIMFYYLHHLGSDDVCKEVKLCEDRTVSLQNREKRALLVGSKKCTWGPAYWCASVDNANECGDGARSHCKEKVWMGEKPAEQL